MTSAQLEALARIAAHRGHGHATDTDLLLDLLEAVATTAASHYQMTTLRDRFDQDGEIDAIAILDTITGKQHLRGEQ